MRIWKSSPALFAAALLLGAPACKRSEPAPAAPAQAPTAAPAAQAPATEPGAAPEATAEATATATPPKPVIPVPEDAFGPDPDADPAAWPPEVKQAYDGIRGLPEEPRPKVMQATMALARLGADALPALRALTFADLPDPHRAYAAIFLAEHHRFDPEALARMARSTHQPFLQRQAVELLAALGGPGHKALLDALGKADPAVRPFTQKAVEGMPADELPAEVVALLNELVSSADQAARERAAARLRTDFASLAPGLAPHLERLVQSPVTDRVTQNLAAVLLVAPVEDDILALQAMTARDKNRFVRYAAMRGLAKQGEPGRKMLERLLDMQDDPLFDQIRELLAARP